MRIIGIDLAGSERRDSGVCVLDGRKATAIVLHSDAEILGLVRKNRPKLVAIDAPLSLPSGRRSIDVRDGNHFRGCDLELRRLGIRFFPITLGPMRMLTRRGMALKRSILALEDEITVVEAFPGATYDVLGARRKDARSIRRMFRKAGIRLGRRKLGQDELDAVACALTGRLFLGGRARSLGKDDGAIIVPEPGHSGKNY